MGPAALILIALVGGKAAFYQPEEIQTALPDESPKATTLRHDVVKVRNAIAEHWELPTSLDSQKVPELETWVLLKTARTGEVERVDVTHSSGNRTYDHSVVQAIYKASPLPFAAEKYSTFRRIELHFRGKPVSSN